jgi:hypothetical protein
VGRNIGHFRNPCDDLAVGKYITQFIGDHFPQSYATRAVLPGNGDDGHKSSSIHTVAPVARWPVIRIKNKIGHVSYFNWYKRKTGKPAKLKL